jgi:hypothetical protein
MDPVFLASEGWMTVESEVIDFNRFSVTVTVDATDLEEGNYQDWVRTEVECVGCTRVILEVIDPTSGVPEDPAMLLNSWGQLKTLYR